MLLGNIPYTEDFTQERMEYMMKNKSTFMHTLYNDVIDVAMETHSPHGLIEEINDNEISFSKEEDHDSVFSTTMLDNEEINEVTEETYGDLVNNIPPPLRKKTTL